MLKKINIYIKVILSSIKYSKKSFILYFLLETFSSFYSIFIVVIMSHIITSLEFKNIENLYFWTGVFIIVGIINLLDLLFVDSSYSRLYNEIEFGLTRKYYTKFINLDNTKVELYGTGMMNNILSTGIDAICFFIGLLISIFIGVGSIIYIFIIVFTYVPNIYYFIVFLLLFLFTLFLYWKGILQISNIGKKSKNLDMLIDRGKIRIIMSKFEVFQNNKIKYELDEIGKVYKKYIDTRTKGIFYKSLWQLGPEFISQIFYILIFLIIGVGIINGQYNIATFSLLVWILQILSKQVAQIKGYMRDITRIFIDIEKLVEIFDTVEQNESNSHFPDFIFKKGDIILKNIDFSYNDEKKILSCFNLKLEGGKKYAFVGKSGGGKSTIMKLLILYILPNAGKIIIDNQDISQIDLKSYYKNIGYLSQDPSIFDGTILENLLYALNYIPDNEKLQEVIKLSKCEFIYDLENKIETQIGEKGVRLSGGQKQRLAIAKIMLKNPNIIFLDEPTSSLDSFNEQEVSIAFSNLFKNRTVIIIAHRLQTVKNADKIFFIENGKIVEDGSHNELLDLKGNYYNMIELQSGF